MNEALVLLALVWAAVLVSQALRSRRASPHATVGGFERAMDVLRSDGSRAPGRQVFVPRDAGRIVGRETPAGEADVQPSSPRGPAVPAASRVVARRRAWFVRSLLASVSTLVLAIVFGAWLWAVWVITLSLTLAYVAVLRRLKLQRDEARQVVYDLDLAVAVPESVDRADVDLAVGEAAVTGGTVRLRRWDG